MFISVIIVIWKLHLALCLLPLCKQSYKPPLVVPWISGNMCWMCSVPSWRKRIYGDKQIKRSQMNTINADRPLGHDLIWIFSFATLELCHKLHPTLKQWTIRWKGHHYNEKLFLIALFFFVSCYALIISTLFRPSPKVIGPVRSYIGFLSISGIFFAATKQYQSWVQERFSFSRTFKIRKYRYGMIKNLPWRPFFHSGFFKNLTEQIQQQSIFYEWPSDFAM